MRMRLLALAVTLVLALAGLALASAWPRILPVAAEEPTQDVTEVAASGDETEGKRQFNTWCTGCHGPGGNAPDLLAPGSQGAGVIFETLLPLVRDGDGHSVPPGPYRPTELSDRQI